MNLPKLTDLATYYYYFPSTTLGEARLFNVNNPSKLCYCARAAEQTTCQFQLPAPEIDDNLLVLKQNHKKIGTKFCWTNNAVVTTAAAATTTKTTKNNNI